MKAGCFSEGTWKTNRRHFEYLECERYQELWPLVQLFNALKIGDAGVVGVRF